MKLLILNDRHIFRHNDEYLSDETFWKFIWHFRKYFDKIIVCVPVFNINSKKIKSLYKIPKDKDGIIKTQKTYPYRSVIEFYLKFPAIFLYNLPILVKAIKNTDLVFMRLPAMNSFLTSFLAKIYKKPIICYFVGDERVVVETGSKYKGFKKKIALFIAQVHNVIYKKMCRKSIVSFYLSSELKNKFQKYNTASYFVFTSLVEDNDIHIKRKSYKDKNSINLLYVGGLRHEKGVEYLIQSMQYLVNDKLNIRLQICGDGPEKSRLQNLVNELGLKDVVNFFGFIPWGKELSEFYIKSNIVIVPSLSEGIPKVLTEAMAKGLAIVATNVGGIPDIIKDKRNGILIPPGSPNDIANAIKLLTNNDNIRKKIIENGYEFIKEHTVDKQVQKIMKIIGENII